MGDVRPPVTDNQLYVTDGGWMVRVPATTANLGAGYDVVGLALTLYADAGLGEPPEGAGYVDRHHPADVAYRLANGRSKLWMRSPIPAGRGLGFSGAARVAGAAVATVERHGVDALGCQSHRRAILEVAADLEHHADNAAPSVYGGMVVAADGVVATVSLGFAPIVLVWVPYETSTSTDQSRAALPDPVSREDAVFNLGRVAMLVAACTTGDTGLLRTATADRLHQSVRLDARPDSARALRLALEAGAWAAWLSGSGPTVAAFCSVEAAAAVEAVMPSTGHVKHLQIDTTGACVIGRE